MVPRRPPTPARRRRRAPRMRRPEGKNRSGSWRSVLAPAAHELELDLLVRDHGDAGRSDRCGVGGPCELGAHSGAQLVELRLLRGDALAECLRLAAALCELVDERRSFAAQADEAADGKAGEVVPPAAEGEADVLIQRPQLRLAAVARL